MADEAKPEPSPETARAEIAAAQLSMFQASADKVRQRADATAKAIGGLGTTVLTAIGIASVVDLFPTGTRDWKWWLAALLLVAGFIAMASVVAFFTQRLWSLNQPILVTPDPAAMKEAGTITAAEEKEIGRLYDRAARREDAESLAQYEARGQRYGRIAGYVGGEAAKQFTARATRVVAEVQAIETRALSLLVRRRATSAIKDRTALSMYGLFVAALLAFGISADYLKSVRSDEVAVAKACGDARAAGAQKLPGICGKWKITTATAPTAPAGDVASALKALGQAVGSCEAKVLAGTEDEVTCAPIEDALDAATSGGGDAAAPAFSSKSLLERRKDAGCKLGDLPDRACSPGAIFAGASKKTICAGGYTESVRDVPRRLKRAVYEEYGIETRKPKEYEIDHIVNLGIGGSNDIANLFPQRASKTFGYVQKNRLENRLRRLVCKKGGLALSDAQKRIAKDWVKLYREEYGSG